jgi:hypothetical protein
MQEKGPRVGVVVLLFVVIVLLLLLDHIDIFFFFFVLLVVVIVLVLVFLFFVEIVFVFFKIIFVVFLIVDRGGENVFAGERQEETGHLLWSWARARSKGREVEGKVPWGQHGTASWR